jgi:hypothetical protein
MTTARYTPAPNPIDALPVELQQMARDLSWDLFQEEELPLYEARAVAAAEIGELLAYAIEWDASAAALTPAPSPEPEPEPPAPMSAADRKAAYHLAGGLEIRPFNDGYLVPSGTRSGLIHFVNADRRCSCEAGQHDRPCWHVSAVKQSAGRKLAA